MLHVLWSVDCAAAVVPVKLPSRLSTWSAQRGPNVLCSDAVRGGETVGSCFYLRLIFFYLSEGEGGKRGRRGGGGGKRGRRGGGGGRRGQGRRFLICLIFQLFFVFLLFEFRFSFFLLLFLPR